MEVYIIGGVVAALLLVAIVSPLVCVVGAVCDKRGLPPASVLTRRSGLWLCLHDFVRDAGDGPVSIAETRWKDRRGHNWVCSKCGAEMPLRDEAEAKQRALAERRQSALLKLRAPADAEPGALSVAEDSQQGALTLTGESAEKFVEILRESGELERLRARGVVPKPLPAPVSSDGQEVA